MIMGCPINPSDYNYYWHVNKTSYCLDWNGSNVNKNEVVDASIIRWGEGGINFIKPIGNREAFITQGFLA